MPTHTDRVTKQARIDETVDALAHLGPVVARRTMIERYNWSRPTYARYLSAAIERMRSAQLCKDAERFRAIEAFEAIKRDPAASAHTRARCEEMIARINGTLAPTLIDQRVINVELPANVRALLDAPDALRRALAEDTRYLSLPSPTNAPPNAPTHAPAADLPPR